MAEATGPAAAGDGTGAGRRLARTAGRHRPDRVQRSPRRAPACGNRITYAVGIAAAGARARWVGGRPVGVKAGDLLVVRARAACEASIGPNAWRASSRAGRARGKIA